MSSVEIYRAKVTELIENADITTVSARGIRKQIEQLTNTSLGSVKHEFDELVMEIYEKITDDIERRVLTGEAQGKIHQQPPQQQHHQPPTQHAPLQQHAGFALPPTSYVPPKPAPVSRKTKKVESDSEGYSSLEDNGPRRSKKAKTTSTKKSTSSTKSKGSSKKDTEKPKRKQPVNEDGTPKVNNFTRPMIISDKLNDVVGHAGTTGASGRVEMSRPEVVKQLWAYIKERGLQDEKDKRTILCDAKLTTLFGQDKVNCFSMNKYLSAHLSKPDELV